MMTRDYPETFSQIITWVQDLIFLLSYRSTVDPIHMPLRVKFVT